MINSFNELPDCTWGAVVTNARAVFKILEEESEQRPRSWQTVFGSCMKHSISDKNSLSLSQNNIRTKLTLILKSFQVKFKMSFKIAVHCERHGL